MSTRESIRALQRGQPSRHGGGSGRASEAAAATVRERIDTFAPAPVAERPRQRFRLVGASVAAAIAAATVAIVLVGSPGGESAAAAFEKAATVTAASAERSGTAVVRITHDGDLWAGRTIRWNGSDLATSGEVPSRRPGAQFLVVDGIMYGTDPADGGWVELGSPKSIDPESGTTPDETLAAVREDIGGGTLRRFTGAMRASTPCGGTTARSCTAARSRRA